MKLTGRRATLFQFAICELIVIDVRAPEGSPNNWHAQLLRQARGLGAEHIAPFDFDISPQLETLRFAALIPVLDYLKWARAATTIGALAIESKMKIKAGNFGGTKIMSDGFDLFWLQP